MSVSALPVSSPDSAREVFLAAGMRLYPELGYQHLSVRLLAAEAGLSPGMFHHLFANKEAFVAEVLQRKYDAAFAELQLQVRPGRSVRENLRAPGLECAGVFGCTGGRRHSRVHPSVRGDAACVADY